MSVTQPTQIMDVLRKIQALDDESRDIRTNRDAMVSNLERLRKVLGHLDRELDDKRGKLAEAESWNRKKSSELETEREKLNKAKSKLTGVTKSKEYIAVNKELENVRKNIARSEDEVTNLLGAVDEFRAAIAREEEKVKDLRSQAIEAERENQTRLSIMDGKIAEVDARRAIVSGQIDRAIVSRYNKIAAARAGIAVVGVTSDTGCCQGCNMTLQPRFVENIIRGSSIVCCPHCSRYLYADFGHDASGAAVIS